MRIDWWTLAFQVANFLVLVWLLQHFLYRPVLNLIADRQQLTDGVVADANSAKAAAEQLRADLEQQRGAIARERDQALEQAHASAKADAGRLLERTRADAEKLVAEGRERLAQERAQALELLRHETIGLGLTIARRLLAEAAGPRLDAPFLTHLLARLQALGEPERRQLVEQLADGVALQLVTAEPLEPGARQAFQQRLQPLLGREATMQFAEDPELIAGAELHFPHTVLRHSWRDSLGEIEAELTHHGGPEGQA
jgi:F-type H+-transporting ATPase subunit b